MVSSDLTLPITISSSSISGELLRAIRTDHLPTPMEIGLFGSVLTKATVDSTCASTTTKCQANKARIATTTSPSVFDAPPSINLNPQPRDQRWNPLVGLLSHERQEYADSESKIHECSRKPTPHSSPGRMTTVSIGRSPDANGC